MDPSPSYMRQVDVTISRLTHYFTHSWGCMVIDSSQCVKTLNTSSTCVIHSATYQGLAITTGAIIVDSAGADIMQ